MARWMYVGATTISMSSGTSPALSSVTSFLTCSTVSLHFQLPPTKNLPLPTIAATDRLPVPLSLRWRCLCTWEGRPKV